MVKEKKTPRPKAQTPKGFRDYFGVEVAERNAMLETIVSVYHHYGFDALESSAVETIEALGKFAGHSASDWLVLDVPRNLKFGLDFGGLMALGWHNSNLHTGAPPRSVGLPLVRRAFRSVRCFPGKQGVLMDDTERLDRAQEALGYIFQNPEFLYQSLRHPSSTDQRLDSCERMEFLGDSILGMVVVDYLLNLQWKLQEKST